MKRKQFLKLLGLGAVTATIVAKTTEPKKTEVGVFVDGKQIASLEDCTFTPYRLTASHINVSEELIEAIK